VNLIDTQIRFNQDLLATLQLLVTFRTVKEILEDKIFLIIPHDIFG
jgi:hypothetical protein